jgi:hypothetical protein
MASVAVSRREGNGTGLETSVTQHRRDRGMVTHPPPTIRIP